MTRRFSSGQKIDIFIATDGKCAICGTPLEPGWHADHVYPYSKGGSTELDNSQPLCPKCNWKKGDKVKRQELAPWTADLRKWQQDAFQSFFHQDKENYLIVATPGSGKTMLALRIAHWLLEAGTISRIVIVVPTDNLRDQWKDEASKVGLHLDPKWANSEFAEAPDMHGIVVTYQQVGSNWRPHYHHCLNHPTLVIFDEIHHVGDKNSWGAAIQRAFDPAAKRVGISGTLFRTDNNAIPYVEYDEGGRSRPDFIYGYGEALADDVCRQVYFPSYNGNMEWWSNGLIHAATFEDDLSEEEQARRLNTALDPEGDWLRSVIKDADQKLTEIRNNGHAAAAGLVIARDQEHAKDIAALMQRLTGQYPTLAISDDPDATDKITEFRRGYSCWIVAVKMVSEGVDIPRLRVCIYATNVTTELFFRQAVGRVVRVQPDLEQQDACFFIPADKTLVDLALQIKQERDHQLAEEQKLAREGLLDRPRQATLYASISSEAIPGDWIFDEGAYTQQEISFAKAVQARASNRIEVAEIAKLLRAAQEIGASVAPAESPVERTVARPLYDEKKAHRNLLHKLVSTYAYTTGKAQKDIFNKLAGIDGIYKNSGSRLTIEQINARIEKVEQWLLEATNANQRSN